MSYSSLATLRVPAYSGNYTKGRYIDFYTASNKGVKPTQLAKISEITVHHMSGKLTAKRCGELFQAVGRAGSSHYGIGYDGEIALYVSESDTAWTNSNWESNCRAVTIETSNDINAYPWSVSDASLKSLIKLVADIAKRNNLGKLVKGKNLTWHQMYANTDCPGPYLLSKMDYIISEANKIISPSTTTTTTTTKATATAKIKTGDKVKITGTQYYDGKVIPSWVKSQNWFVLSVSGDRAVIDKSEDGKNSICSPINTKDIAVVAATTKTTTATKETTTTAKTSTGTIKINGTNRARGTNELIKYSGKVTTGTNEWGFEVPFDKNGVAMENPKYKGNTAIPSGGFVLSGHDKAGDLLSKNIKKGYRVTISNNVVSVDKKIHRSVDGVDKVRGTAKLIVYKTGKTTGTNEFGFEVPFDVNGIALDNPKYKGNTIIPSGGFVLSGHQTNDVADNAGDWIKNNIKKGTKVSFDGKTIKIM